MVCVYVCGRSVCKSVSQGIGENLRLQSCPLCFRRVNADAQPLLWDGALLRGLQLLRQYNTPKKS